MSPRRQARPRRSEPLAWLEARIPPPLIALAAAGAMYALHADRPVPVLWSGDRPWPAIAVAGALAAAGLALAGESLLRFVRRRTWFHPTHPERASTLVVDGAYRWTRNPMYLGLLLMLAGFATWLGTAGPFALLPAFGVVITRLQIVPEERALLEKFGGDYARYRDEVGRWFGRR